MSEHEINRRRLIQAVAGMGITSTVFQKALAVQAQESQEVTAEMIRNAEWIAGVDLSEEERAGLVQAIDRSMDTARMLREIPLDPSTPPALVFQVRDQPDGAQHS